MKIITDLPDNIVTQVRGLVSEGRYPSISDFLYIAAENQLALEFTTEGDILNNSSFIENFPKQDILLDNYPPPHDIFEILQPDPHFPVEFEWDSWLWGQINRLLPIKFAVRYLAIMSAHNNELPDIKKFHEDIGLVARKFGNQLIVQDRKLDTARDKKLSTGFPTGENSEKSRERYISQFVGYMKSDDSKTGALFDLKFANIRQDDKGVISIGLTPQGRKYSMIPNPVIDDKKFTTSLNDQEVSFYIDHIMEFVPGEVSLFRLVLSSIDKGITGRDALNNELSKFVKDTNWSNGLVSTQRSGAISRLYEIGMITKLRKGLKVRYQITPIGKEFLRNR